MYLGSVGFELSWTELVDPLITGKTRRKDRNRRAKAKTKLAQSETDNGEFLEQNSRDRIAKSENESEIRMGNKPNQT